MKKLLKSLIALALIVAVVAVLWMLIAPLVKEEIGNYIGGLFETTTLETTKEPLPEGAIEIPYYEYFQDPESGEYLLKRETTEYILRGYPKTYEAPAVDYYTFNREKSNLLAEKEGDVVALYYDCETCKVVFHIGEATLEDGYTIQTIRKGQIPKAPTLSLKGYALKGYDKPLEAVYADTDFTPQWEIANYLLRLHVTNKTELSDDRFALSEYVAGCFETTYTFYDSLTLPTPKSQGYTFLEWNTSPDGKGDTVTTLAKGTTENTTLYAIYTVELFTIAFHEVEGVSYPAYYLPYDTAISAPIIPPEQQKAGYGLTWYTDEACTKLYDFRTMPNKNIALWGKWEEDTGQGFLTWDPDKVSGNTIDSLNELIDFIDYVRFHNLTEALRVEITYTTYDKLKKDMDTAQLLGEFRANGSIAYTTGTGKYNSPNAKCYLSVRVNNDYRDKEAKKTAEPTGVRAYKLLTPPVTPRGESYTDFYIDKLTYTYPVSTTNQLHYVVEHGYRPIVEEGSPAETAYLAARKILNEILPEDATHFEKAELIFNYLITEIQYDDNAVRISQSNSSVWPEYDAYYLEGVFNNKKAVCDGIAKAYSLMCNIEGIPCVEVVGPGHAWNRVKIDNRWYVVDATFGNLHISGSEKSIADHSQFLISDAEKTAGGYAPQNYPGIIASKNYGYYYSKTFTYGNIYFPKTADYVIESVSEFRYFLQYLLMLHDNLSIAPDSTVNFYYNIPDSIFEVAYRQALRALESNGFSISNQLNYYGNGVGSVYKIVFQ